MTNQEKKKKFVFLDTDTSFWFEGVFNTSVSLP